MKVSKIISICFSLIFILFLLSTCRYLERDEEASSPRKETPETPETPELQPLQHILSISDFEGDKVHEMSINDNFTYVASGEPMFDSGATNIQKVDIKNVTSSTKPISFIEPKIINYDPIGSVEAVDNLYISGGNKLYVFDKQANLYNNMPIDLQIGDIIDISNFNDNNIDYLVIGGKKGVRILDNLSDPNNLQLKSILNSTFDPKIEHIKQTQVENNHLYLLNTEVEPKGFTILKMKDVGSSNVNEAFNVVGGIESIEPNSFWVYENHVYFSYDDKIEVYDLSDLANPQTLNISSSLTNPEQLITYNHFMLIATADGVSVFDISDSTNPILEAELKSNVVDTLKNAKKISVVGDRVYILTDSTLEILKINL